LVFCRFLPLPLIISLGFSWLVTERLTYWSTPNHTPSDHYISNSASIREFIKSSAGTLTTTDYDSVVNVYNNGDIAWTLASTALVWIMIPGVGYLYSGLLRRKNVLGQIYMSIMVLAVASFQWFFWGYSLAFSETGSKYIGNLKYFGLKGVLDAPSIGSTRIPALVFCVYQLMFAAITPMLTVDALTERGRLGPVLEDGIDKDREIVLRCTAEE
ncbi:ammonium transporter AmtB-like domain-containing protein, partial [Armillaria fumosa]